MVAAEAVTVRLLGRPAVLHDGEWTEPTPGRMAALLYYLAFHGGWVGRSDLVYLFWPDAPEATARGNLRPLLSRLAREPYAHGLERERSRVRWLVRTDVQAYRELLHAQRWREAWELGRSELLTGFDLASAPEFGAWLEAERSELKQAARRAGGRAIDELQAAGDHGEAIVIAAQLHRGDPLDEAAARRHMLALTRAGDAPGAIAVFDGLRSLLAEEVGVDPTDETVRLAEALRTGTAVLVPPPDDARAAPPTPVASSAHTLPHQPTRFVGREREVAALIDTLEDEAGRLLTVVGPGGVGKTRLAIEVARRAGSRFEHGTRFVDLSATREPEALIAAVAGAVGAEPRPGRAAVGSITEHLRSSALLLVLDNMEQVIEEARELVARLVAQAPAVRILATSRVRLGYRGERVFDLAGLPYRAAPDGMEPEAVSLFIRALRRVRPGIVITRSDLERAHRICEIVGGLPLALELAAAWLRVLSLGEIEAELASGLELLEATPAGVPRRHAGMRPVFDHSWSLLRPRERKALRDLSVFHGGWTREAAAAVADAGLPVHLALRDASLIWRDAAGRFGWHPLVGKYARERATERPAELDAALDRHARYFLGILAEQRPAWWGDEGAQRLAEVEAEMANLEAACRQAIAGRRVRLLTEALHGLEWLISASRQVELYVQLVREIVALGEPGSMLRGRALTCLAAAATWRNHGTVSDGIVADLEEAIAILQEHDALMDAAWAHRFLGMSLVHLGRITEAREVWRRALELHRSLGDAEGVAMMLNNLGDTAPTFREAISNHRAAIAYGLDAGAAFPVALASDGLGHTLFRRHGALPDAIEALERAVALGARTGFHEVEQHDRRLLAQALAARGELASARACIESAIAACEATGDDRATSDLADARALEAWIAWLAGDERAASQSAHAALTLRARAAAATTPGSEALAHLVLGWLALERQDLETATVELGGARSAQARVTRARPGTWHDFMAEEPDALAWTRLLAAEAELAGAMARPDEVRAAAEAALRIALRSQQDPAAALALVIAAGACAARDDIERARGLIAYVGRHPATPFEALSAARRLEAGWPRPAPDAAATLDASTGSAQGPIAAVAEGALLRLRTRR
jgi:predicted ATPase/DNA-binding SARP family transcriptional activator